MKKWIKKKSAYLIISLIIITLLIACLIMYFSSANDTVIHDLSINLISEIIGIGIAVFGIDFLIRQRDMKERRKIIKAAFSQFNKSLYGVLNTLNYTYKASSSSIPNPIPKTYQEAFLGDDFLLNIKNLNVYRISYNGDSNWCSKLHDSFNNFEESINNLIDKYGFVLSSQIITGLEDIIKTKMTYRLYYLRFRDQEGRMHKIEPELLLLRDFYCYFNLESAITQLKTYLELIFSAYKSFKEEAGVLEELKYGEWVWSKHMQPSFGCGIYDEDDRIILPLLESREESNIKNVMLTV